MIDPRDHFVQIVITQALMTAMTACDLSSDQSGPCIDFDGTMAVREARKFAQLMVLDPYGTVVRKPNYKLNDLELANMLVLEVRTACEKYTQIGPTKLPRRVFENSMPPPGLSTSVAFPPNPLDAAANALGIPSTPKEFMTMPAAPDLASLMRDPKKLGEFLAESVKTVNEIPRLIAQIDDLKKNDAIQNAKLGATEKLADERAAQIADLEDRLKSAMTKASLGSVASPNPAGKGNDLPAIANAMHITVDQLKAELDSFVKTCALPLPNAVRWPAWCDPSDKSSPLPFCYRHSKPVFLAGESGTGKTFIAEALCMVEAGRRCAVTFHEKISYNKLFVRETVDGGKVRSVLGPILLSMLTGTPIVLDEIDHADIFVQSLMHEVLDKRRVFIPELAISIQAEPGCRMIATGNSLTDDSGQYHGDVGTALRTRFAAIHVEYPDLDVEAETVVTASGCDKKVGHLIATTFKALRNAVTEQKIAGPISVRESCAAGTLYVQGKQDKLTDDQALGLGLGLMVVQKRPPAEQLVAAEICATVAKVNVGSFMNKVKAAGAKASAGRP